MLNYHDFIFCLSCSTKNTAASVFCPCTNYLTVDTDRASNAVHWIDTETVWFLPGFLWLCCKWERLRGISLFCWKCIICPVSGWLIQVMEEENRAPAPVFQLLFHETATKRDALHPACPKLSISAWRALSHPLQNQSFWQALQFFHSFPTYFQRICIWLLMAHRVKLLFQSEGVKGNFWLGSVVAGGTLCTWIPTCGSKGRR